MQEQRSEGIVLKATPFREYDAIVSLFTHHLGLAKLLVRGGLRPSRHRSKNAPCPLGVSPFTCAEFTFFQGSSDLGVCKEIEVIDAFPALRTTLPALEAAGTITQLILTTQWPGKHSPQLYLLLRRYLALLGQGHPPTLAASFRLKLLRHEGLLFLKDNCCQCGSFLQEVAVSKGEMYCLAHAPSQAIDFTTEEWTFLWLLAHSRSAEQLLSLIDEGPLGAKIQRLFETTVET